MRALAALSADECARRIHAPTSARNLLDIGGSHGLYSVALCRRYSELRAVILDLPEAVEHAGQLLAREEMGERVRHVAGDARNADLGVETYDIILMSQLAHHFSESENRELAMRVADALRPGGVFVLQELIRCNSPTEGGQVGGLMDLWFALTSESGTWSFEEMASWQRDAGLIPQKPVRLRTLPSAGQQSAIKPAH
jgi:SAM-dependent methyltransferase